MMSLKNNLTTDNGCQTCGFTLWEPISLSEHSKLGLYNDDRFPGRCILILSEHKDSIESLPMDSALGFMRDIQVAMQAIRESTGAKRVNVAIMGNRDPHLHAHLVPRYPESEQFPDCSPWNDPRTKKSLPEDEVSTLKELIFRLIQKIDSRFDVNRSSETQGHLFDL